MAVFKPRERLVYFRISEDEFRQFASVCEQAGARSVSDLARSAVQRLIAEGHRQKEGEELAERMHRLDKLIAAVSEQLELLTQTRMRGSAVGNNDNGSALSASALSASSKHNGREQ